MTTSNIRFMMTVAGVLTFMTVAADAATTTCSTVAACLMGTNSSSGPGVGGTSKSGFGLSGISTSNHGVNGTSSSSFGVVGITSADATASGSARAGVLGEDSSTNKNGFNSGVSGTSTYGFGVLGSSTNNYGIYGTSQNNVGVVGDSKVGIGGEFESGGPNASTFGAIIASFNGTGLLAESIENGPALNMLVEDSSQTLLQGQTANTAIFSVDGSGNEILAGSITTNGSPLIRTRSTSGTDVASFGSRSAQPSIEDVGKGELRNGVAYVALDKTFASTIDPHVAYSVFLTPEGDSNSLYTMQLTPSGFAVRESKGGRSSLVFDYRIVAKPYDAKAMHLPAMSAFPQLRKPTALPKLFRRSV